MRHFNPFITVVLSLAVLAGCASTASKSAVSATPKVEPKMVEVKVWKPQTVVTSYSDGVVSAVNGFQYDAKGNALKEEQFNGKKILESQKTYADKGDGTVEIVTLNRSGDVLGKALRGLKDGLIIRETQMNPKGETQSTEEYAYDAAGNKIRWTVKTAAGNQISTDYTWLNGVLVGAVVSDAGKNRIKRFARTYDEAGLLTSEEEYDAKDVLAGKIVYVRDGAFVTREEKQSPTGAVLSSIQYKNDADGNPLEIRELDRTGRVIQVKSLIWQVFTHSEVAK